MTHATDGLPTRAVGLQLDRIADELADRFHGVFGRETVELFARETYDLLAEHATITVHLPALTARFARERLLDLGAGAVPLRPQRRPLADGRGPAGPPCLRPGHRPLCRLSPSARSRRSSPIYPGKRYLDWDIPDPDGEPLHVVRRIRDEIDRHVRGLLDELGNQP